MAAGWYPDPAGRFDHRYHDGTRWTDVVARAGVTSTDPAGAPDAPPPAPAPPAPATTPPATTPPGEAAAAAGGLPTFVSQLEHARERPVPQLEGALAAAAGVLVAFGLLAIGAGRDVSTGGLIAAALVLLAGGYVLAYSPLTALRPAATALVAAGIIVLPLAVFRGATDDGKLAGPLALMTVLAAVAYAAPLLRGRPFLLGLALLGLLLTLGWLVLQGSSDQFGGDGFDDGGSTPITAVGSTTESVSAMVLIVGAAYVACTALLDRRGYRGLGTVFAAVGIVGVVLGTGGTAQNFGSVGGAILVLAAGAVLAAVGAIAHRRATLWIGVTFVASGVIAVVAALLSDDPSPVAVGLLIVLGGLVVGAVAWLLARRGELSEA